MDWRRRVNGKRDDFGSFAVRWQKQLGQPTLDDVRHVLLAGSPQTIEDLQGLVMDELEALQGRLRDGTFNSVLPFWDAERPHIENYCRDRLAEHLEPYLLRFGVRVHSEATMPDAPL